MMFARTTDLELVRSILTHPKIYPLIGDDSAPPWDSFRANEDPRIWYVIVWGDFNDPWGLFMFLPDSDVCWWVHAAFLPEFWGCFAQDAGEAILAWVWEHTPCRRVVAQVPAFNRLALRFGAKIMGMQPFGVNQKSFLKNGAMWDQVLLGASRPQ